MRWQILCDFDGTITPGNALVAFYDRFCPPGWREQTRAAGATEFGSRERRVQQTDLVRGSKADIDSFLDTVEIDPGFPAFVAETMRVGLPLTIVSDGYDYSIRHVFARHGIEHLDIVSNKMLFLDGDRIGVEFPFGDKDCAVESGTCKCSAMGRLRNRKSVLIGDGISDFCTAGAADFVFARDRLIDHCRAEGIPFFPFRSFDELTPLLAKVSGDGAELQALAEAAA